MKKTKFMIGALVLSMGLLGTGYAYWTDSVNVNTTVDTGKLAVEFGKIEVSGNPQRNDKTIPPNGSTNVISNEQLTSTKVDGKLINDNKVAQFTLTDLCPGYTATAEMTVDNVGTMAAMLEKITVDTGNINGDLAKELGVTIEVWNQTNWEPVVGEMKFPIQVGTMTMESIKNIEQNVNNWIENHIDDQDRTIYVDAKGDMKFKVIIGMATDAKQATHDLDATSFGIKFGWTQYNAEFKKN